MYIIQFKINSYLQQYINNYINFYSNNIQKLSFNIPQPISSLASLQSGSLSQRKFRTIHSPDLQ